MAGKDIEMNDFALVMDALYVYGELADGSQVKFKKRDLLISGGICKLYIDIGPGASYELPYSTGLIIIRDATLAHENACAIIEFDNKGKILATDQRISFFSEVANRICVFKSDRYIVKNTYSVKHAVGITMIGQ